MIPSDAKIITDPRRLSQRLGDQARPWVFTNGCFDILHRGHVSYLEEAAGLGASLIVGVNTDDSVKRLSKGNGRPVNPLEDRLALLAALECVALVVPFGDDTPLELIKSLKPDYLVKGGDWKPEDIVGSEAVTAYGGKVRSIPIRFKRSTTDLIKRIQNGPLRSR